MPKFYKQNKKRVDPRYFLNETIEEAVIDPGLTGEGPWPGVSPQDRVKKLAHDAMAKVGEPRPPWEAEDEEGDGFTDASLSEADFDILRDIHKHLSTVAGGGNRAEMFAEVMSKLGIDLGEAGRGDMPGSDVDVDDMEDALGRFQDTAGQNAWANKRPGPKGVV